MADLTEQEEFEMLSLEKEKAMFQAAPAPKQGDGGIIQNTYGVLQGAGEFVGALPGVLTGIPTAAGNVLSRVSRGLPADFKGESEGMSQYMEESNIANKGKSEAVLKGLRDTWGYKNIGSVPAKAIGMAFEGIGKIAGTAVNVLGQTDVHTAEEVDAATQLIAMALSMKGGKGAKPGSPEFYQNLHEAIEKGKMSNPKASEQNQESYKRSREADLAELQKLEAEKAAAEEASKQDMNTQAKDLGQDREIDSPSQYNNPYRIDPETKARIEEEHNLPNAPETRVESQGELFTDVKTDNPNFVLGDAERGARDKVQTPEQAFEIGREVEHPTYTADQVNGARQQVGPEGFNPEPGIPYKEHIPAAQVARRIQLGRKQGGVINPDLLTLGTAKIWEDLRKAFDNRHNAVETLLRKFNGTFGDRAIQDAIKVSRDPQSKETIVLMSPDDFHRAAAQRDGWYKNGPESQFKREQVKEGLKSPKGLTEIPFLNVILHRGVNGQLQGRVIGHEGRHRMDVFKEQGIDQIPVSIRLDARGRYHTWGDLPDRPDRLLSEEFGFKKTNGGSVPFPDSLSFPRELGKGYDLIEQTQESARPQVPLRQRGAIGDWFKKDPTKGLFEGGTYNRVRKSHGVSSEILKEHGAALDELAAKMKPLVGLHHLEAGHKILEAQWKKRPSLDSLPGNLEAHEKWMEERKEISRQQETESRTRRLAAERIQAAMDFHYKALDLEIAKLKPDQRWRLEQWNEGSPRDLRNKELREEYGKFKGLEEKTVRLPYVPKGQRGAIGDWDKRVAKKGVAQTLLEEKKVLEEEKRPLDQIVREEKIDPKTIKDLVEDGDGLIGRLRSRFQKVGARLLIDRTLAILAMNKEGTGKIVKWAVDARERIDRLKDIRVGYAVKVALEPWARLKSTSKDLREMLDVWQNNVGKTELKREHFKNDKQWEVFNSTRKVLNDTIARVNETRAKYGLKQIPALDNYLPAIWQGDYRVWIKDGAGTNVGVYSFKNTYQAKRAAKFLREEHPDLSVEDPVHIKKTADYHDFSAFEEAMTINAKDYAATKALHETYGRLLRQKGFGPHGMFRQNLYGYLGFEKGRVGVTNIQLAIEAYIKRAENHIANIEKSQLGVQLDKLSPEIQEKIPQTMTYLRDYLSQARGVDLDQAKLFVKSVEAIGEDLGFGRSAGQRFLREVSGFASLYFLVTPKFFATQILQPLNMIPKLLQLQNRLNLSPVAAGVGFWKGYSDMLFPTGESKAAVKWAKDNDFLDPAILALMNMKKNDLSSERGHIVADLARLTLGGIERHAVRTPTFLAFNHLLKDSIKNPEERYSAAARLMDYYMVHYDTASSPLVYNDMGIVGEATRPLKQYAHNTWGQFFEYVQGATNRGEIAPLAAFMSNQALVAGLRGMIGFAEATAIISAINSIFGMELTTPEQYLLKSGMSDWAVFGAPSTLTGYDMSSSVAAPALPQMFSVMPISFAANTAHAITDWMVHYVKGDVTDKETMALALATTPAAMRGYWEEFFSQPGQPVPHVNMEMKGTHVRTDTEKKMAIGLGVKSIKEARHDAEARIFKQIWARDAAQKLDAVDAMVDRVTHNVPIEPWLVQKFVQEGGDPAQLPSVLRHRLQGRTLPFNDRQLVGPMSVQKMHKLQTMKDALDRQHEAQDEGLPQKGSGGGGGGGDYNENPKDIVLGRDYVKLREGYLSEKTKSDASRIRAGELGNSLDKIQAQIDLRTNALNAPSVQGTKRQMMKSEIEALKAAKEHLHKMAYDPHTPDDRPENGIPLSRAGEEPPSGANDPEQLLSQKRGQNAKMPFVLDQTSEHTRTEQLRRMQFEESRRLQLLRRKHGVST